MLRTEIDKVAVLFILRLCSSLSAKNKLDCGYKQCPMTRDGALNVHLIPHSHMDAGWVKTFDEYYYGTKSSVSSASVQLIYHSVLSELLHDKRRKFTFSESSYFWRWWKEQRPPTRVTFRSLVQEGRVEFAGGSWVQNDEATVDYLQIIDQYTWGLRKLNDTLGPCGKPKAAWQIDTYGHSREQASLLAQMGFDGLFLGRVDYKEREAMMEEDRMEFMWRGSDVLGKMSDIMTHTLFNLYNAPDGFCFDFLCTDEPIVDDADNVAYNADKRVNDFIAQIERQAKYYDHDNIMVTMGGDFTYQSAANWFLNMDKLINHVNTHPANLSDINIFYSTPSCFLKAIYLYGRRDKAIFTEREDLLPYGSDATTYWTGFYSSRPSLKFLAKRAHVFLQVVKQLSVLARSGDSYELHVLRHAVGLVLHHDAITGTSQQHVTNDFLKILTEAIDLCSKKISSVLSYLTPTWGGGRRSKNHQQFIICHQTNMSQCRFFETQTSTILLIYNPLSVKTYFHVRLPAVALHYSIRDYNDDEVDYQLVSLPTAVINLPGRSITTIQELVFEAENIPPLGYSAFLINSIRDPLAENKQTNSDNLDQEVTPYISNEYMKVTVNKDTGLLETISHMDGIKLQISQNFLYYSQAQQQGQQSGAYTFRPDKDKTTPVSEKASFQVIRGSLVKEIRQRFNDWATQIIRLYRGEEFVELEWIIGPVPIGTDLGKEIISVFSTNISNNGEFFTDSNGRQMMKRSCWNDSTSQLQKKSLPSCYYPVTSRICIHSANTSVEMCVLTDRPQGGTSYQDGQIELMVHRRLLTDDSFGLDETLNEEAYGVGLVVRGKHRIIFGNFRQNADELTFSERVSQLARRWQMEPWVFLTAGDKVNKRKWQNVRSKRYSPLYMHGLPRNIHVLTLEPWKSGSVLLRLENVLETADRASHRPDKVEAGEEFSPKSAHITVDIRKIFLLPVKAIRETTLAANQWLDDARQMDWSTRYVYSGGDDGILPEDIDYGEDKSVRVQETSTTSDEEADYGRNRKKHPQHAHTTTSRHKKKNLHYDYDRKKRSANFTENVTEFTNDTKLDRKDISNTFKKVNDTKVAKEIKERNVTKDIDVAEKKAKLVDVVIKKQKVKNRLSVNSDVRSSEEEFEYSRSYRRKMERVPPETDDADDGVTKSIYEMYYKTKPRSRSFKPFIRNSEEDSTPRLRKEPRDQGRYRKQEDYDSVEVTTRRAKRKRARKNRRMDPEDFFDYRKLKDFSVEDRMEDSLKRDADGRRSRGTSRPITRLKRRKDSYDSTEYDVPNVSFEREQTNDDDEGRGGGERKKRAMPSDEVDPKLEPYSEDSEEYLVTLRPTQIRTFVIWFQTVKKTA
ncbi:lysosomal alpha-mannosidase-like isoform X2 [Plodia interpunctella]|uniref:lysosomal alpha-mannosidase-like isoform X2 n=1 Tax=Plodia interpunctella TaxID=58824 RepID=UPI0023689C85|nr:lysosomal alpha-mannosidase-like isoform X2 [Plodia interpunctella]